MIRILLIVLCLTLPASAGGYDPNVGAIPIQHKLTPPPDAPEVVVSNQDDGGHGLLISSVTAAVVAIAGALTAYFRLRRRQAE